MKKCRGRKLTLYSLDKVVRLQAKRISSLEKKLKRLNLAKPRYKVGDVVATPAGVATILTDLNIGYEIKYDGTIGTSVILDGDIL